MRIKGWDKKPLPFFYTKAGRMSQFDDWPADDLRLFKQSYDDGKFDYLVYSFQMDALSPVDGEEIKQLRQLGVLEISELPE